MHKLEYEMRDVFTLLEAKRYGLDEKKTKEYLVRIL